MAKKIPLELLGEGPYPFSVQDTERTPNLYWNHSMIIIENVEGINFYPATHMHSSYEFMYSTSQLGRIRLEGKTFTSEPNKILPINSEQAHGSAGYYNDCRLFAWQIDAEIMKNIAYSMYGRIDVSFSNDFVSFSRELALLFCWFKEEFCNKQVGSKFILDAIVTQTLVTLLRQIKNSCSSIGEKKALSAKPNILRTIEYLNENFNKEYSLEDVAHVANLSPYHFIRLFKSQTGKTPYDYLLDIKIEKAKELLKKKHTVTEVCFLCGFNNVSHFTTLFKRKVGAPPSCYKKIINR